MVFKKTTIAHASTQSRVNTKNMGKPRKTDSEKKKSNKARYERYKKRQVNVGDQADRWSDLRGIVGAGSDRDFAKLLIDRLVDFVVGAVSK